MKNKLQNTSSKISTNGLLNDNIIFYNEDDIKVKLNLKKLLIQRESNEIKFEAYFDQSKKTKGSLLLKAEQIKTPLIITTNKLVIKNQYIEIDYLITIGNEILNENTYILKYEVI